MSKIGLIITREYLTRVRKKSFIIMTILGPILTIAIYAVPIILAMKGKDQKTIAVIDQTKQFKQSLLSDDEVKYIFSDAKEEDERKQLLGGKYDALLLIPPMSPESPSGVKLLSQKNLSLDLVSDIRKAIEKELKNQKLKQTGISQQVLDGLDVSVSIDTKILAEKGDESDSSSGAATAAGFISALLIYIFIFMYGVQVMRGVIEEKTSRIIEVMVSSVKPFELMMGKVVGIALVGLTQFIVWIGLSYLVGTIGMSVLAGKMSDKKTEVAAAVVKSKTLETAQDKAMKDMASASQAKDPLQKVTKMLDSLNFPMILSTFLFFFIGGYLLYGALFAAIGSSVDAETDTQQFMLPVTIPLIIGFMIASSAINDPESATAVWASIIPFTSPIVMMVRIPFGVPMWQLGLSMAMLVGTFVGCIWLAGRIYRVGILMYGKKVTYKELSKWLFYKI